MAAHLPRQVVFARNFAVCAGVALALSFACDRTVAQSGTSVRKDFTDVVETLRPFIQQQIAEKELPALSIAIIDDQQIVWAQGFGMADPKSKTPASADTVYRIGSVSKLFTDIGIMQLVERGELDLDTPVQKYLPDFHPHNPFG